MRRGASVTLTDIREQIDDEDRLRAAGVALELGGHHASTLTGADLVVLSPGVPSHLPAIEAARRAGVPVTGELELASRWLRGRIVAITGTKGKSTTTTLTGRMLEAGGYRVLVGGNIGLALSAQVDASTDDTIHVDRGEQLSARERADVPAVDCRAAELLARPSRSARDRRRVRRRQGAHLRQAAADGLGGAERRRSRHAGAGRRDARASAAVLDERRAGRRRRPSPTTRSCGARPTATSRSCRWPR